MTIGTKIRTYRKERQLTQENLAKQLNVSAGAVSKWETGTTLPDTELLVPLANALQVSLDELFDFSLKLSELRVKEIGEEIASCFEKDYFSKGLLLIERYTQEFPHSEELIFQAAHLVWKYSLLTPFKDEEEVRGRRRKALELYRRLFNSDDELMRLHAMYSGAVILMTENNIEELEVLLKQIPSADYDTFYMHLHVLESKKEYLQAQTLSINKLFSRTNEVSSLLAIVGRIYEEIGDNKQAAVCFTLLEQLEQLFQLISPSMTAHRKIKQLMKDDYAEQAALLLENQVSELVNKPLNWEKHFLFSSIKLSAADQEQKKIRRLYLQEMLEEFNELADSPAYQKARDLTEIF